MADFRMPSLGADMDHGTVVRWRVSVGDVVRRGDIVAEVDTDKSTIDVEIFEDGVVEELLVSVGTEVPVGTPLARIRPAGRTGGPAGGADGGPPPAATSARPTAAGPSGDKSRQDVEGADSGAVAGIRTRVRASPLARRRSQELGVDLATLSGSGPDGAVVARDVARSSAGPVGGDTGTSRAAAMRRSVASLVAESNREVPHYYVSTTIDLGRTMDWLHERNEGRDVRDRLVPAAVLLKAVGRAARATDCLNGFWVDGGYRSAAGVHLGVVVSLREGGLLVPVLHDADALPLDRLMTELRDLVGRARAGRLRSSEVAGATISVTNLGELGVDTVHGIIHPPQVALVGFGRIADRPWVVDGELMARPLVVASLAGDHRASDGLQGAAFLTDLDHVLQHPEALDAGPFGSGARVGASTG